MVFQRSHFVWDINLLIPGGMNASHFQSLELTCMSHEEKQTDEAFFFLINYPLTMSSRIGIFLISRCVDWD